MKQDRQYAVEILERWQHGRYEKEYYFGMYVPGHSKKDAELNAMEFLSEMTFAEISERCVNRNQKPWEFGWILNEHLGCIGWETANQFFTCRAYIEKGDK